VHKHLSVRRYQSQVGHTSSIFCLHLAGLATIFSPVLVPSKLTRSANNAHPFSHYTTLAYPAVVEESTGGLGWVRVTCSTFAARALQVAALVDQGPSVNGVFSAFVCVCGWCHPPDLVVHTHIHTHAFTLNLIITI